jgi:hypothetical protein
MKKALPKQIKKEMVMGMKAEKIHKVPVKVRKMIVKDHLKEDKHYYSKLKKAGL